MFYSPKPMHVPDGFYSAPVAVVLWVLSILLIGLALRRANRSLTERDVPLMGVLAAAIFAGQMLNFTVTGGTSGHMLGAALAAILLGPWPAMLVMTAVVSIQALIFQDGGLLALGGNLFNMAVVGVWVAYAVYRLVQRLAAGRSWSLFVGGFSAAWLSLMAAALACALQLAASGTSPASLAVPAMAAIHALIGIGEGLITVGALAFLFAARRDLLQPASPRPLERQVVFGGLLIAVLLVIASPLASSHPDGLEWVAEQQRFIDAARGPLYQIIPDYLLPGVQNKALATILAGLVGLLVVGAAILAVFVGRRRAPLA